MMVFERLYSGQIILSIFIEMNNTSNFMIHLSTFFQFENIIAFSHLEQTARYVPKILFPLETFVEKHIIWWSICVAAIFLHIFAFQVSAGGMQNHVNLRNEFTYDVRILQLWRTFMRLRLCRMFSITIIPYWNKKNVQIYSKSIYFLNL